MHEGVRQIGKQARMPERSALFQAQRTAVEVVVAPERKLKCCCIFNKLAIFWICLKAVHGTEAPQNGHSPNHKLKHPTRHNYIDIQAPFLNKLQAHTIIYSQFEYVYVARY